MQSNRFSQFITIFHERTTPEKGLLAGYGALINAYGLKVPLPCKLALISEKHKRYETEEWKVFTPRHAPAESLIGHLTFSLKYEGIDLHVLKALFEILEEEEITQIVQSEPTGNYSRRIWFLYEWLLGKQIPVADSLTGNFVDLIDTTLQYPGPVENSKRHHVRNNLPGVKDFCPLIRRTEKLDKFIAQNLSQKSALSLNKINKGFLMRAAAFLLLKDSKASYAIEGETPQQNRAQRWGRAIGQAGLKPLTKEELLRLQQIVIENDRFTKLGLRTQGGFIGEHDRASGTPIPNHISARWQDIESLITGLINTSDKLEKSEFDGVLAATIIAFGFVFIHPFVDGNGRIHRYLIHHVLAKMGFAPKGIIFPVSSAMFDNINNYREVLEAYSSPRLDFIDWKQTPDNNIEVLNNTIDLYRYFDATQHAEYLYACVENTIEEIIPEEVAYLQRFDNMKTFIDQQFDMPDKTVALLIRFLEQGNGKLSKRARENEFKTLDDNEVILIENAYRDIFHQ